MLGKIFETVHGQVVVLRGTDEEDDLDTLFVHFDANKFGLGFSCLKFGFEDDDDYTGYDKCTQALEMFNLEMAESAVKQIEEFAVV